MNVNISDSSPHVSQLMEGHLASLASSEGSPRPCFTRGNSLTEHGEWSSQFIQMGLPSFRPTYLFIVRIQLDVIHESLKLRKDQRPIGDPSFLSIRQVIEVMMLSDFVEGKYVLAG